MTVSSLLWREASEFTRADLPDPNVGLYWWASSPKGECYMCSEPATHTWADKTDTHRVDYCQTHALQRSGGQFVDALIPRVSIDDSEAATW